MTESILEREEVFRRIESDVDVFIDAIRRKTGNERELYIALHMIAQGIIGDELFPLANRPHALKYFGRENPFTREEFGRMVLERMIRNLRDHDQRAEYLDAIKSGSVHGL